MHVKNSQPLALTILAPLAPAIVANFICLNFKAVYMVFDNKNKTLVGYKTQLVVHVKIMNRMIF